MPELDKRVVLAVRPLAPLSMVDELPGSFYKTLKHPSKKMICGLFENMLGWHFDKKMRLEIFKDMVKVRKKLNVKLEKGRVCTGINIFALTDGLL